MKIKELYAKIKYKVSLQKEIEDYTLINQKLEDIKKKLDDRKKEIEGYNELKIAEIEHLSDPNKSLIINLIGKEEKVNFFKRIWRGIFKFDGWVLYINKAEELRIMKISNFKTIQNLNDAESYAFNKKIGTLNGKPIFLIKYPFPITLDIKENTLIYDSPTFYNYVNKVTMQNLTNFGSSFKLGEFLKKNFILIILLIIIILLFTTPQGKEFLAQIIPSSKPV